MHSSDSPVIDNKRGLGESLQRVLWLWWRSWLILFLLSSGLLLLLLLWLLLWCLLLLWWGVGDGLLDELGLTGNGLEDVLVDNGLVPTVDVGVLRAPLLVEEELVTTLDDGGSEEIGEGEALADEVGVDEEVVVEDSDVVGGALLAVVDVLLVVCVPADQRAEPASESWEDLSVGEGHPAEDGGVVLLGLAEEGGLLVLGGDCSKLAIAPRGQPVAIECVICVHIRV